jgi:hypothetical protein
MTVDNVIESFGIKSYKIVNEEDRVGRVSAIVAHMTAAIEERGGELDTRDIDKSKGDPALLPNYYVVNSAIGELAAINPTQEVRDLAELLSLVRDNAQIFKNAYKNDSTLVIWFYRAVTMELYYGTMVAVATSIEVAKVGMGLQLRPSNVSALAKTRTTAGVRSMSGFILSGKLKMLATQSGQTVVTEGILTAAGIGAAVAALVVGLFIIRHAIYVFFAIRRAVANEFDIVTQFLEINASLSRDKVISKKQEALARRFSSLADKVRITDQMVERVSSDAASTDDSKFMSRSEMAEMAAAASTGGRKDVLL